MPHAVPVRRPRWGLLAPMIPAALLLAGALAARPAAAADPFYLDLLREGSLAYDRGEAARAARDLKLACFGLLDEPKLLGECLSRLALAEDKRGDAEGFRDAFRRLSEVEERFDGYSQAAPGLPAALRTLLEKRLVAALPAGTLEQSPPAFRNLAPARAADARALAAETTSRRARPKTETPPAPAVQKPAAPPTGATRPADPPIPAPTSAPSSIRSGAAAPKSPAAAAPVPPAATPAAPAPAKGLTAEERTKLDQARRTLDQPGEIRSLSQAFDLARAVADAHAESSEAQHLAGEAAYRIKRFKEAAEYFRRGGDPGDGQPELLFYQAVSLFELGNKEAAAAAFRRALPNLRRTPYVDGYAGKILGP